MAGRGRGLLRKLRQLKSQQQESDSDEPSSPIAEGSGASSPAPESQASTEHEEATRSRPATVFLRRGRVRQIMSRMRIEEHSDESSSEASSVQSATPSLQSGPLSETPIERSETSSSASSLSTSASAPASNSESPSVSATASPTASGSNSAPVSEGESSQSSTPEPSGELVQSPQATIPRSKIGQPQTYTANYVKLTYETDRGVNLYSVAFDPQIDSIAIRKKLLYSSQHITRKIGNTQIFNGTNLFLPLRLNETLCDTVQNPSTGSSVTIQVRFIKTPPSEQLIMFYNNLFNQVMRELKLVQINRHHFDPTSKIKIPTHKLEVWPGHVCAIHDFDGGLMLNCDTSHRVLRTSTARDAMQEIFHTRPSTMKESVNKILIGCTVLTRYNNRTYRIDDVDFEQNPTSRFSLSSGEEVSYLEYFKKNWNIEIADKNQPLLIHRPKTKKGQQPQGPIALIPELSFLTGLTDDIRNNNSAMKDLASHTRLKPEVRRAKLIQFLRKVSSTPRASQILSNWGIKLDSEPIRVEGRKLRGEELVFGGQKIAIPNREAMWRQDATNSALLASIDIKKWAILFTQRDKADAWNFCNVLIQVAKDMGFSLEKPKPVEIFTDSPSAYVEAIKSQTEGADLVVIMTPGSSQREDRYGAIKRICIADLGRPSQVVRANTLQGAKMRSVCQNIALQICCKVGGELWALKASLPNAIIIGMDAYHDPTRKSRSVLGFVASLNSRATKWYSKCYFHNKKEEISNNLKLAMKTVLKKYTDDHLEIPKKVFIFRDGVGDGDLPLVSEYEVSQINEALSDHAKQTNSEKPLLTFTVVQKRINTKLMCQRGQGEFDNPGPGSFIDHTVTRKNAKDFFLISQHVRQGTVTPTHYVTLLDENEFFPDKVQKLTYMITHLYFNFPATIRVPAPCQYAHKLAYMVGQYCQRDAKEPLCNTLFYL